MEIAMKLMTLLCGLGLAGLGLSVQAGGITPIEEATDQVDLSQVCEDTTDQNTDECLLLPPVEEATNFVFALAPLLPLAAAAGLIAATAGGGGGGSGIGIGTSTPNSTQ
jgi:hypothetical protein